MDDASHLDNPAGRLFRVMSGLLAESEDKQILQALRDQLGINQEPYSVMWDSIAKFFDLAPQADQLVQSLDNENHDLLLRWHPPFNEILPLILTSNEPLRQIHARFTQADLFSLEVCADALHRKAPEPTIDTDQIPQLIELLREAIDAISSDANLPPLIRIDLIDKLREVERALSYIRVNGYGAVQDAWDKFTGAIVRTKANDESGTVMRVWNKFMAAIGLVTKAATTVGGGVESVTKAIEAVQNAAS